jgi:phospholipase C
MFLEYFIQNKFGKTVREENISAWRRAISGNLTSAFRSYDAKESDLDFLNRDKLVVSIQKSRYKEIPSDYRKLDPVQIEDINRNPLLSPFTPHQEPGIRPACALPYELYAEGMLSADGSNFELLMTAGDKLHGKNAAGAPFNVYLRNKDGRMATGSRVGAATYAVKPGDTLHERFPLSLFADSKYAIDVHGPNGFYRSFMGDSASPHIQVHTTYEERWRRLTGNVRVHLHNTGSEPFKATIRDNSYGTGIVTKSIGPGHHAAIVLHLKQSHGWYDFTVKVSGSEAEARFAGRVETGRPGFSDPLMGGVA